MSLLSPYRPNLFNVGRWLLKSRPRYICTLCNTHRRLITTANNLAISQPTRESSTQSDQDVLHAPPYVKATSSTQDATAAGHAQAPHHSSQSVGLKGVNRSQGVLKVMVDDELREFDHKFLRDACSCPRCVDPSTKQKRFQTADIPSDCKPKSTHRSEAGTVRIVWRNDIHGYGKEHMSEFTPEFFQSYVSEGRRLRARHSAQPQLTWNQKVMKEKIKWVNYEAFMNEEKDLLEALEQLSAYGLVFLRGVPDSEHEVESIGTRIGSLRDTFYGRTWDVKSVPNAKNVA